MCMMSVMRWMTRAMGTWGLAACVLATCLAESTSFAREPWPDRFAMAPDLPFEPLALPNAEPLPPAAQYQAPRMQATQALPAPAQAAPAYQPAGRPTLAASPAMQEIPDASVLAPTQEPIAAAACGPCDDGCPGYRLYAVADALFMTRYSAINDRPLVLNENTGATLLSSQDLQWGFVPGIRAFFGERRPGNCGWEVGYLGLYGLYNDSQVFGPANLIAPGDVGANANQFNSADLMNVSYQSTLNMAEANLFWYDCCGTDPCQTGAGGCQTGACEQPCSSCRCIDWLAGFRWAGLQESADFSSTCCGLKETSVYGVGTASNLFGAQVGVRGRKDYCHWACEGWMKLGLAGVWMSQTQSPIIDFETGIPYRKASESTATGLAGFADANASAIYKFNQTWGLRLGLNAIWLGNVALAPNQWDFSQTAAVNTIDTASLVLLGANVGLEARW